MKLYRFKYAGAALILLMNLSVASAAKNTKSHRPLISVTDLKEISRTTILMEDHQNQISVIHSDGTHSTVKVRLNRVYYQGTLSRPAASGNALTSGTWHCYELDSIDQDHLYHWSFWAGKALKRFKLLTTSDNETFLTWIDSSVLYFTSISHPIDLSQKNQQLNDSLNQNKISDVQSVEVCRLIGQEQFINEKSTDRYSNIFLTSLEKDGNGGFKLQLHGNDSSKNVILVTDHEAEFGWRLESN